MKCVRCGGTGLIEMTGGLHSSSYWMKGEMVTVEVEATPERPVYKQCGCGSDRPTKPKREPTVYA